MRSFDTLLDKISLSGDEIQRVSPGAFVKYTPMKIMSSQLELASSGGWLVKRKKRDILKTVYEFLALNVWHDLLKSYSDCNDLLFRAPKPIGILRPDSETSALVMTFLNGYELRKLNQLRKTIPVKIPQQEEPLPLFSACALYLGALNRIKEWEGLQHSDYDDRHVIFSHTGEQPSIGVVDVENTLTNYRAGVAKESRQILDAFKSVIYSEGIRSTIEEWSKVGNDVIKAPNSELQLTRVVDNINNTFGVELDLRHGTIDGISIVDKKSLSKC